MVEVIIVGPNPDPAISLGGVSSVVRFIITNNYRVCYTHFEQGSRDTDNGGIHKATRVLHNYHRWQALLNEKKPAVIHYNIDLSPLSILRDYPFMRLARRKGCRLIIHVHGGVFMTSPTVPLLYDFFLKKIFNWDDSPFIVLSEREKARIEKSYGAKNIHVLPNCVGFPSKETKDRSEDTIRIGYFGRITEAKGMQELLDAAIKLKEKQVHFKIFFAGKKEPPVDFVELFTKELGDSFQYIGIVSGKAKNEFLSGLDVFVLPSYFEGLPMSLLESMSYGIVPVVTAVGSIPEVVEDGENGLIIKDHDVDTIVAAIERINNDKQFVAKMSSNAKETILTRFNPEHYIESLNGIYNKLQA